ncbi:uncharacterized protein LOC120773574 [Bactrocera tryoni]|uniref:uncharacterized protein LOC120773574 n=1 Tax=Bactrocera tryoni TaxID=59916 RepID=UPI001A982ED4|nr:uncharacterized protein LOC120773574 [Bactrocera tryoni]
MKVFAYVLCMFVASVNSGYTLPGSALNEEIDFKGDFSGNNWHEVNQEDGERSLTTDYKSTDVNGDYGGAFGNGKPITEVMQEERQSDEHIGLDSQDDYSKYTRFIEDAGVLASKGASSTGWYGIPGDSSDFSGHSREHHTEKVIHEAARTGGLGSFRTLQPHVGPNDHVHHETIEVFSEPLEFKATKAIHGEEGDDEFGAHGGFSGISAGQSNYDAGEQHSTHFGENHSDHHEDNQGEFNIFNTHIDHGDNTDHNQFGAYGEYIGHQGEDYSHGYHEYGGFNFAKTEFDGYENKFGGYKSDGSLSDVA